MDGKNDLLSVVRFAMAGKVSQTGSVYPTWFPSSRRIVRNVNCGSCWRPGERRDPTLTAWRL